MRLRRAAIVGGMLVASCGGADQASRATESPTTDPSPTTMSPTTSPPPAAATTTATTPTSSTSVTTSPPRPSGTIPPAATPPVTTTTNTTTTTIVYADDVVFGRPDPALLDALPAEDIPWSEVGSEWLAIQHPQHWDRTQPLAWDQRGLFLVDPDDRVYALAALPSDGNELVAGSWTGRVALFRGPYEWGLPLGVLDLETTVFRHVVPRSEDLDHATFTRDGTGLWIYDLPWSNFDRTGGVTKVSRVDLTDRSWTTVLEEHVEGGLLTEFYNWWVNNRGGVVELPSGEIVTAFPSGIWRVAADGTEQGRLDTPGAACSVVDVWDADHVLASCAIDTEEICDCGSAALWLVPTDGDRAEALAVPDDECMSFSDAEPLGEMLAVDACYYSGECNTANVLIIGSDGPQEWTPPIPELACNVSLIGRRNDAWLIVAANPYLGPDFPVALYEVSATETRVVDVPTGRGVPLQP